MGPTIEEVQELVGLQLGIRKISPQDRFIEDLGAESADLVNIIAAAEDKFNMSFEDEDISHVRTVHDLHALIRELA